MRTTSSVDSGSGGPDEGILRPGLEGVVVAETRLSEVDGARGRLIIAGSDVEDLSGEVGFEGACLRLWGEAADEAAVAGLRAELGAARVEAFERLSGLGEALRAPDGMDALRAGVAHCSVHARAGERAQAVALTAATAVYAAAWGWLRLGLGPVAPDARLGHAEDYLRMARVQATPGARVSAVEARAMERYLVTVIDHGLNASTFAARVVASTGSDVVSAVVAAIGALKGPLHGGAPGPVLDMLDALGDSGTDGIEAWLGDELAAGRRIMGMGHRIYRVRDPRAAVLEEAVGELARAHIGGARLARAREVERAAERMLARRHPARALRANVEFYTAVLLEALGLGRQAFTPTFAVGRVAGWCAHVAEQRATGRLIRPASRYVGPMPARSAAG